MPQRLQQRAQFQALLRGPALVHTAHFALHGLATAGLKGSRGRPLFTGPGPWLGAVVPKRWARRAVTRNTLKRQIAAAAAEWPLPPGAWLVRLRRAFAPAEYPSATSAALRHAVRAELRELLGVRLPQWLASGRRLPSALDGSGTAGVARADARRTASSARAALERGEVA
ncbi:Ribonuclease P protein component [Tepidimonas charontis]|uniref:Ribonuclease P protein component n=1 Tax=Tepidimonas charontis TaxID=2267262 RepID=A0A554XC57_9BURK|nr:Ribonuclease P protein component [Tepidimonas charontis]